MNRNILLPLLAIFCAGTLVAGDMTTISGHVVGSDGKPMPKAHVHLLAGGRKPFNTAEVGADGSFTITSDRTGMIRLQVTGVDHAAYVVPLLIETPRTITLDLRLAPRETGQSYDDVKIIGDFNDFDFGSGEPLLKQKNGTYMATIKSSAKVLNYQLLFSGPGGPFSMNGTQSAEYIYDGGGDYRSVVPVSNGSVKIVFDPSKLPHSIAPPSVIYRDSVTARLAGVLSDIERHREMAEPAKARYRQSGKNMAGFTYDWSGEMKSLLERARRESDQTVRNGLLAEYVDLTAQGGGAGDPEVARRLLAGVRPGSGLWDYDPELMERAIRATGEPAKYDDYRWKMVESHPDTNSRVMILSQGISNASEEGRSDLMMSYYNYLTSHYPDAPMTHYARAEYGPDRRIMTGKPLPHFSLAAIGGPSETYSNETMKGKYYMIDFWATWCGPCVGEMPNLHKAYDKYHMRNFEIISLSFDDRPETVGKFRKGKWKMPWRHAFVEGNFDSDLAREFEVVGIPKPILVDGNGVIVAAGDELRGEELDHTLARLLGTPN